jgi:legumain
MRTTLIVLSLLSLTACANWAVIVAGSNGYGNYRHQSNVYHTYQVLKKMGMHEDHIITFAYGDIAEHRSNPIKGKVFNRPDGEDVYRGVKIDYYGKDVNPKNYIAAITGDKKGIKLVDKRSKVKVLGSTKEDHVYLYYSDHGGDRLIAFPGQYLYANQLISALKTMHQKGLYGKLVFYLEACHSGSMFNNLLPANLNIYAVSASRPNENHYGCYCGSEAKVHGTLIGSCLGGQFTTSLLEDIDKRGQALKSFTLQQQYQLLTQKVTKSHPVQYGDKSFLSSSLYYFISGTTKVAGFLADSVKNAIQYIRALAEEETTTVSDADSRLFYFRETAQNSNDLDDQMEYLKEVTEEAILKKKFELFRRMFGLEETLDENADVDFDCYKNLVDDYTRKCNALIDRDFKYMGHFANFCSKGIDQEEGFRALDRLC